MVLNKWHKQKRLHPFAFGIGQRQSFAKLCWFCRLSKTEGVKQHKSAASLTKTTRHQHHPNPFQAPSLRDLSDALYKPACGPLGAHSWQETHHSHGGENLHQLIMKTLLLASALFFGLFGSLEAVPPPAPFPSLSLTMPSAELSGEKQLLVIWSCFMFLLQILKTLRSCSFWMCPNPGFLQHLVLKSAPQLLNRFKPSALSIR